RQHGGHREIPACSLKHLRMKKYLLATLAAFGLLNPASAATTTADVVVYGGVPSGIAASIAAAREGAKVVLIEPTKHVGGLSTSGLNTAETEHMLKWTFGGIALEFYERLGKEYGTGKPEYFFESSVAEKAYNDMLREAGVEVRFGLRVDKVGKEGAKIRSITLSDGSTLEAKAFIDASYEGDLMARAGVKYAVGREAVTEFNEDGAGVRFEKTSRKAATVDGNGKLLPGISGWVRDYTEGTAHRGTMNYNWRLTFAKDPEKRVPIPEPQNYDRARYKLLENWLREKTSRNEKVGVHDILDLYPRRNGKFEVNNKQAAVISIGHFGGQFDYPDGDMPHAIASLPITPITPWDCSTFSQTTSRCRKTSAPRCASMAFTRMSSRTTATGPIRSMSAKHAGCAESLSSPSAMSLMSAASPTASPLAVTSLILTTSSASPFHPPSSSMKVVSGVSAGLIRFRIAPSLPKQQNAPTCWCPVLRATPMSPSAPFG
ncbi:MAG: hypothetical protein RL693_377, partial [Verrucomicrobiota bacterium]